MPCLIKFNSAQVSQQQIMSVLAANKIEAIQTANGLCAKASPAEVEKILDDEDKAGIAIVVITGKDKISPDVAKFLGQSQNNPA